MICSISHKPWRKAIGLLSQVQKTNDVTISSLPKAVFSFKLVTWTKDHKDKLSFLTTTYVSIGQCLVYPPCRFSELCSTLEPGRPARTDKLAILGDAIRVVNQLKSEALEYKETNEKLLEEIKTLKAEKNELREEKLKLKADKEKMEQELKAISVPPPGFMATHPAAYQSAMSKMPVFPGYSLVPMWQYMPSSARDTSQDHKLRPPAA